MKPALAPIEWVAPIPAAEAVELQGELVWRQWDRAAVLGNTAISQFLNRGARFTVLEELQASARAAA